MGWLNRARVFVLAAAVGTASVADCLPSESMTPSQMACCVAVDHDCNAAGMEKSCCPAGARDTTQAISSTPAKELAGLVVAKVLVAGGGFAIGPSTLPAPFEAFSRELLKLPKRPTYLLVSTLLI